ncbi:BrnT family toxin [Zymomonas mobilis]|uniref:BrnT family toxin n=1 Tax=Zymomonas mobilis TaxID=542 RepID=UPI0039EA12C1
MKSREFDWDDEKSNHCLEERGFDFAYAAQIFFSDVFEKIDSRYDYGEQRIQAVGFIDETPYLVVYTIRSGVTRIISARRMHKKEWRKWLK